MKPFTSCIGKNRLEVSFKIDFEKAYDNVE
jgi:hypothetical protein